VPIRARPAGPWLRARRWVERSPVAAAALASVVLALATGLTTTLVLLGRARAESNARERALIAVGEARTRADAGFAGATEAIDEMLTEVAMGTLTEVPGAATERRRLLEDARDLSLEFLRTLGDDPRLEARVGQAYLNLGTLRTKLNEESAAVLELERGLWLVSGLAERDPTARPLLAQLHCQYASCLAELGRGPEAIAHQELGLALCEERLARAPRERARILALAHAELLGGAVNQRLDRDPEAERCWHRALRRLDLLAASGPLSVQQRMLGVTARRSLGDVIGEQRGPEAELLLCQAIGELEALRGKVAERSSHQALLAECWLKYGRRREDEVDDVGADAAYRIALHHLAAPEARASELPTPRYLRACCLRQRAQLLYRMGAIAQAEAAYEAALDQEPELLADAGQNAARLGEVRSIRYERAAIRAERGRWDSRTEIDIRSRLALQEHLLTLSPNDPEALAACGEAHSLLGRFLPDRPEAEEHLRKAEEVLDRAVECAADPGMVRLMRAGFHLRAGRHWAAQGQKGRAARSLRLARKECESMTRTRPGDVRWARVHVSTLEFLVPLVADPAEQEQVYVALVNLRRAFLASGDPGLDAPRYWSAMGRLWGMRWKNGNDEARDRLLECVCALRGLIEADPRDPPNRAELARTLYYLSQGHAVREQWKEARSTIDESLELLRALHREVPKEPLSRRLIRLAHFHRISILRATDGGDEARAEAARLLALDRSDVEDACTAAEALALCAVEEAADSGEREGYASKAVAGLEEAVRRGLRDPARLRDDRSFRVLGGREDFERLLRRLGPGAR
jgi:tetratricopeptide (TPR) repeat protein